MAWPKAMSIVEVEWIDSNSEGGWSSVEQYLKSATAGDTLACRSTGYLFHKDKRSLTLVQSQSQKSGYVADSITIPRFAVKSLRVIDKPPKGKGK
jgi:hypothetical protein